MKMVLDIRNMPDGLASDEKANILAGVLDKATLMMRQSSSKNETPLPHQLSHAVRGHRDLEVTIRYQEDNRRPLPNVIDY